MAYRGLKSDLDVLQTVYTPFAGQHAHNGDSEEEDSENEVPPQRFAGGGGGLVGGVEMMAGFPRRGSGVQASC